MRAMANQDLWDEADGFYYDRLHLSDGTRILIGSQRADELAAVLERERRACAGG